MTHQPKTGSVTSKSGKVTVRGKIVTGIDLEGAAGDEVLQTALETMQRLHTGSVSGAEGVEAGEIITGLRYFNPETPDRESFVAELKALRQELAGLAAEPEAPEEAQAAVESLADTIAEAEKEKPLARRVVNRLRESIEFIGEAGKVLDSASKAGPLIAKAIATATVLYQAAQLLF
jgi:hypothetical protein